MNYKKNFLVILILVFICSCAVHPIHRAILTDDENMAIQAVNKGYGVNVRDWSGYTPLHYAAARGQLNTTKALIDVGAELDTRDYQGRTPFMLALHNGHDALADYLFSLGPEINSNYKDASPLYDAAYSNNASIGKKLVDMGSNVNRINRAGVTPLHMAANMGGKDVAMMLVNEGADILVTSNNGMSALHWASINNHNEVIRYLIEKGAMPFVINSDAYTSKATAILYDNLYEMENNTIKQKKYIMVASDNYKRASEYFDGKLKDINSKMDQVTLNNLMNILIGSALLYISPSTTMPSRSGGIVSLKPPIFVPLKKVDTLENLKKYYMKEKSQMDSLYQRSLDRSKKP